jgi:hypothetical protein
MAALFLSALGFIQGAVANGGPDYTLDVQMLVCSNRLIFMPTITTSGTDQAYTRDFTAYINGNDANVIAPSAVPQRSFSKDRDWFDGWNEFTPTLDVASWETIGATPFLQIFSGGNKEQSVPIPAYTEVQFAGGTGTLTDPYLVSTADQLQAISCQDYSQTRYFALANDIDLAGRNFIPIGVAGNRFRGGIDGRGFTISNLTVDHPGVTNVGFIGEGSDFFLRDIRFVNPRVHGKKGVGIAVGRVDGGRMSFVRNVVIEGGVVRGVEHLGGVAGKAEEFSVAHAQVDADVIISTPRYHGPLASISFDGNFSSTRTGGVIGDGEEGITITGGTFDVSITQDSHVGSIGRPQTVAGLIGRANEEVLVSGVTANVVIDLTLDGVNSGGDASGGLFGEYFDEGSGFTDSTATVDIRFVATPAAAGFFHFGGISGEIEETFVKRVDVRGSILIDTSAITSGNPVTVRRIGGAFGQTGGNQAGFLQDSHIDVDVRILGTNTTTSWIGAMAGEADLLIASDVRVGGEVFIEGAASGVGALVGYFDNQSSNVQANLHSIIYRGSGVTVGAGSTNVGVLWGDLNGNTPGAGKAYQGANVYWDANRNGVGSAVADELGLPASSAQLGDLTWLTAAGFDPTVWCITTEDGMSIPAIIAITPSCQGRGGDFEPTTPTAPTNLTATPGNASVTLNWNPPASDGGREADVYTLQTRAVGTRNWLTLHPHGRCTPDTLTCGVATNLVNGQPYDFRVAAENEVGRGPWSSVIRATPGTTPTAPTNLTAAPGDATVTLTWAAPSDDGGYPITSYTIHMTTGVGGTWMPILGEACGATCTVVTGLTNATTYGFRIAAHNTLGMSDWSPTTTAQPSRNPTAPTNLTATPGNAQVTLTWQPPTETGGLTPTYQIDISTDAGSTWTPATTTPCTPASNTCAVVANLTNGTPYTFRVTATTTAGTSPAAGPVVATPEAPTDVPVITRVIPGANRGWLIIATPTPATAGHELSLDDGATWQEIPPHVGDRVLRITGLTNATGYRLQLRSVRADGSTSEPTPTTTLMPTGIRVPAPTLMVAVDPASITTNDDGDGTLTLTIDLLITNTGSTPLTDVWLQWPALPAGAAITGFDTLTDQGTWYALDDWWYGDDVDLAAGATHRVRVSLETQP